jgi:hypothetical protein
VFKLLFLPFRIVRLLLRITGVKGGILLAIGVGVGLLIAPRKGAELRADLQARIAERTGGGADRVPADVDASL